MARISLARLAAWLAEQPAAAFAAWRRLFFDALERRQDRTCRRLLALLDDAPEPWLQQAYRHYLAVLCLVQQQFDQAETLLRDLLAQDLTPLQRARSRLELAILLDEQGEWDEADQLYSEAAAGYAADGNAYGEAKVYNNWAISRCYRTEQGAISPAAQAAQLQQALAAHAHARELAAAAGDDGAWELAKAWHGVGKVYGHLHAFDQAEAAFTTYLRLSAEQENQHVRGYTLTDLAVLVYLPQGQFDAAAAALDEAIPILAAYDDPLNLAEAHMVCGHLLMQRQEVAAALASYDAAIAATESIRSRLTAPTAQIRSRATTEAIYRAPIAVHLARGDASAAFTAAERARARVLADLLARQSARPHVALPARLLADRARICRTLDQAYAALEDGPTPDLQQAVATHEQQLAALDQQIERLDRSYAGLATLAPLDTAAVQARLPAGAALLTWVPGADDRLWMLAVTPEAVEMAPAPPAVKLRWLQGQLADYLDGDRRGSLTPDPVTGTLAPLRLYSDLHRALVAPVAPCLAGAHTLYIVPAGPLHHVPMGALAASAGEAPWTQGRRVVYAPSATVLLDYCHQRPPSPRRGLLALAPADTHLRFIQPAAVQLARQAGGKALVGEAATCQALLRRARNYRVLCFLGHAWFDRRYPMSSRLQLADGSLHASEILRTLRLQADLAILAACETGRGRVPRGDEILGLSRALLYAGTPSLLVTLWRVHEVPTRLLIERLIGHLQEGLARRQSTSLPLDAATALAEAQTWLRTLSFSEAYARMAAWGDVAPAAIDAQLTGLWQMTAPGQSPQADSQLFAHPFFWSPYVLIGEQAPAALQSPA